MFRCVSTDVLMNTTDVEFVLGFQLSQNVQCIHCLIGGRRNIIVLILWIRSKVGTLLLMDRMKVCAGIMMELCITIILL